jgi:flagellar hook assembly protein FlgD
VSVDLYDLRGRRVRRLVDEVRPAGGSVTVWDGRDDDGRGMSSGVYFCILHAESGKKAMKVTLLR